jgi:natural product precursor
MKNLSKEEMKTVMGGELAPTYYTCTCSGGTGGQWYYTDGQQPPQSEVTQDIGDYCSSGAASCIWSVQ